MIHLKKETSRLEDYLEAIYRLSHDKGYASTVDLSDMLNVKPPTVSGMVGNLANKGYLVHEAYRKGREGGQIRNLAAWDNLGVPLYDRSGGNNGTSGYGRN